MQESEAVDFITNKLFTDLTLNELIANMIFLFILFFTIKIRGKKVEDSLSLHPFDLRYVFPLCIFGMSIFKTDLL